MSQPPFHHATVRTLCQATEEPDKVAEAMALIVGAAPIERERLEGQWGQPIEAFEAKLSKRMAAARIGHLFTTAIGGRLLKELPRRVDESCTLYIRFDKQRAAEGEFALTTGDDSIFLKAKVAAYPAKHENAMITLHDVAKTARSGSEEE